MYPGVSSHIILIGAQEEIMRLGLQQHCATERFKNSEKA